MSNEIEKVVADVVVENNKAIDKKFEDVASSLTQITDKLESKEVILSTKQLDAFKADINETIKEMAESVKVEALAKTVKGIKDRVDNIQAVDVSKEAKRDILNDLVKVDESTGKSIMDLLKNKNYTAEYNLVHKADTMGIETASADYGPIEESINNVGLFSDLIGNLKYSTDVDQNLLSYFDFPLNLGQRQAVYSNEIVIDGLPGYCLEGGEKPSNCISVSTAFAQAVKIAKYWEMTEELLTYAPNLARAIRRQEELLLTEVWIKSLFSGSKNALGVHDGILPGFAQVATPFTPLPEQVASVQSPDLYDAINAMVTLSMENLGNPTVAFVDAKLLRAEFSNKGTDGRRLSCGDCGNLEGIDIVPVRFLKDGEIFIYGGEFDGWIAKQLMFKTNQGGEQFKHNIYQFLVEMMFGFYISDADALRVISGNKDAVCALIEE